MELRRPNKKDQVAILAMIGEFIQEDSSMDGFFGDKADLDYQDWLDELALAEIGLGPAQSFVPYIQLVGFGEDGLPLGFLNLRLRLNEKLQEKGGHMGYSIRPSQRGKGYAKEQLRLGLQLARQKNIAKALLTCHQTNQASRAVILANGGKYHDTVGETERYWIEVTDESS